MKTLERIPSGEILNPMQQNSEYALHSIRTILVDDTRVYPIKDVARIADIHEKEIKKMLAVHGIEPFEVYLTDREIVTEAISENDLYDFLDAVTPGFAVWFGIEQ